MKKLKVYLYQDKKIIGEANYEKISLDRTQEIDSLFVLEFSNFEIYGNGTILRNETLKIRIVLAKGQADYMNFILVKPISSSAKIKFKAILDTTKFNYWETYSPYMYDIFTDWINDSKIDWRSFESDIQKKAWIRACVRLTDITKNKLEKEEYVIDFNEVNGFLDFYCLLGEEFLGYKGYMGGDGNAFSDCLYLVVKNSERKKHKIIFKNFNRIYIKFQNDEYFIEEFNNYIIKDFRKNGFDVIIDNPSTARLKALLKQIIPYKN